MALLVAYRVTMTRPNYSHYTPRVIPTPGNPTPELNTSANAETTILPVVPKAQVRPGVVASPDPDQFPTAALPQQSERTMLVPAETSSNDEGKNRLLRSWGRVVDIAKGIRGSSMWRDLGQAVVRMYKVGMNAVPCGPDSVEQPVAPAPEARPTAALPKPPHTAAPLPGVMAPRPGKLVAELIARSKQGN